MHAPSMGRGWGAGGARGPGVRRWSRLATSWGLRAPECRMRRSATARSMAAGPGAVTPHTDPGAMGANAKDGRAMCAAREGGGGGGPGRRRVAVYHHEHRRAQEARTPGIKDRGEHRRHKGCENLMNGPEPPTNTTITPPRLSTTPPATPGDVVMGDRATGGGEAARHFIFTYQAK